MHNFQSDSKKSGDQFEELVYQDLISRGFDIIERNVYINGAGCEVDFIALNSVDGQKEYVEAKGGNPGDGKRPGAQRTDNVKKAIANGILVRMVLPESIYVVYFSAKPIPNSSSDTMLKLAISKNIIDQVRYIIDETNIIKNDYLQDTLHLDIDDVQYIQEI